MTPEENRKRAQDEHVKFIKEHICDAKGDKPYVFISYKSDDWEVVLHDIVYRLVNDYGLNIYFDGSFDSHNSLWIHQFPENMESYQCAGVLGFFDDRYAASYATLLELMYSQTLQVNDGEMPVIPINLDRLTKIGGAAGAVDTGLGAEHFEDGSKNVNAAAEVSIFNETFYELTEREVLKKSKYLYKSGKKLTKKICSEIVAELIGYLGVNENYYEKGKSLDGIVETIRNTCGEKVFSAPAPAKAPGKDRQPVLPPEPKPDSNPEPEPKPVPVPPPEPETEISVSDFLKKYNHSSFKKNTFSQLKLTGLGEYAGYSTDFYASSYELVWAFVRLILEQRGEEYIRFVNDRNAGVKNPPFITAEEHRQREDRGDSVKYRQLDVEGLNGYSMCRHFSQYDWIANVLKKRMQELGLPLEQFVFEFRTGSTVRSGGTKQERGNPTGAPNSPNRTGTAGAGSGGGMTGPVSVSPDNGVKRLEGRFSLPEFISKYNFKTFQSNSCKSISLIGAGEYEKYSMGKFTSARNLVFSFAMSRLDEMGTDYISLVNQAVMSKNPIFITSEEHAERKERKESVSYKAVTSEKARGYSMCTHYSEYHWIQTSLLKQLNALGWPPERFYLEFENEAGS